MYKLKILVLLLLFMGLLPFSCNQVKQPYYQIDQITITAFKNRGLSEPVLQSDSLNQDTTYFSLEFDGQNIADNSVFINLGNPVYALKKAYNGYRGLKNKVIGVLLFSDKQFNGRPPGSSLNELLYLGRSMEEWMEDMNNAPGLYFQSHPDIPKRLILTQRPLDSLKHTFTLQMTFDKGLKKTALSKVSWKSKP